MSWKPDLGWLVRTRARTGAEGKRKVRTYAEARALASEYEAAGNFKEIWVQEGEEVDRKWRDLMPPRPGRREAADRNHVMLEDPSQQEEEEP